MTTKSNPERASLLPFTWIAASALALGGIATAQLTTAQVKPITAPVKDAGVYHLATDTWTRGTSAAALAGPQVIYDNTCTVGYYWGMTEGDVVFDSGRIPSTSSPNLPVGPGPRTSLTGPYDMYEVDGFEIAYCSFEPLVTSLRVSFSDIYAACDGGGILPTPVAAFNLVNFPAGTALGGQGCWIVMIDLSNTTVTFPLGGDGNGTYNDVPSMDSFGWSWTQTIPTTGSDAGPALAGDPLGFFPNSTYACALGVGGSTTFVGASSLPGSGIGALDQMEIGDGPTPPGCYTFGGYSPTDPMASFYLRLTGKDDPGAGGGLAGKYAIRGTGLGVSYDWKVKDMSNMVIASGSLTTVLGASADDMGDQLVGAINGAGLVSLSAAGGGWTPTGTGWAPFIINYSPGGTPESIQLIVDDCNVSNATTSAPCQFNPEIASAGADYSGTPFCFGDSSGTACPCGNTGGTGQGCANSTSTGAVLTGTGNAHLDAYGDTLSFAVTGVNGPKFGLLLRANNQLGGGDGVAIGDGLLCVGGGSARSQVFVTDASGAATISDWNGGPIGAVANPPGTATQFQFWYRDPMGSPCGTIFNFTNAWTVTYLP